MRIVLDTNILVSFFRQNPVNFIISMSDSFNLQLFSAQYSIEELKNNEKSILKYGKISSAQFNEKIEQLKKSVKIVPEHFFRELNKEAKLISPHDKDIPIFSLALKLNCPIWSNEQSFKFQKRVKSLSTKDMIELIL
jgi:predicted nucleic acid-binding protein